MVACANAVARAGTRVVVGVVVAAAEMPYGRVSMHPQYGSSSDLRADVRGAPMRRAV